MWNQIGMGRNSHHRILSVHAGIEVNLRSMKETIPILVKIKDYLYRKYPITFASDYFLDDVDEYLKNIIDLLQ